ncbi:MAG TPA: PIG-L family deacetylase [Chloroflexota bacterium]|nr:PIG-L family deacetylase [Chloroflexota bacterium]
MNQPLSESRALNILVFGAHPDDPDISAGGVAALYVAGGHRVKFVSLTNGDAGHHEIGGVELARRRYAETQAVARVQGLVEYQVLDNHDGELEPTLANRRTVIRIIREFQPDLILGPRPNDYHPDHRYAAQLIQDAAYMVTVPNVTALSDHLPKNPVIAYVADRFKRPYPFTPDVVIDVDSVIERKLDALHCHTSQVYEWLPYNAGHLAEVPKDEASRRRWLAEKYLPRFADLAERHRGVLARWYGAERAREVRYAEAFEISEYGAQPNEAELRRLFPFLPA